MLPLDHRLFAFCGEVVAACVAVFSFEGEFPENTIVAVTAARTDDVRRQHNRTEHFLLIGT